MAAVDTGLSMLNSINLATLFVFVSVACITYIFWMRRDTRVPPGPPLVPIIGNLLSLASSDPFSNFARLRKKYGDIYSLYIGRELTVVLNGFDVIYDALVKRGSLFSRRPMNPFSVAVLDHTGIVGSNDKCFKEHRRLSQDALQHLCFKNGSQDIENRILFEVKQVLDKFADMNTPTDLSPYLSASFANIISSILISKSFGFDDEKFNGFLNEHNKVLAALPGRIALVNCFRFLLKLPLDVFDLKTIIRGVVTWQTFLEKRLSDKTKGDTKEDFIDMYLQALKNNEDNQLGQSFTKDMMRNTSFDLEIAGSQTVATTINWLLLYLLHNSEIETRLQSEIDEVIGRDRLPSLKDRPKMPYTEAAILEGLRIASAAPLAVPHSVPHDVIYKGYLIPKDTTILVNLPSVLMDPAIWEDPTKFRPERFLTADQMAVNVPKYHIPFSVGPRSCLGETLARMELFLYLTSILQRFKLQPKDKSALPSTKGNLGLTFEPDPYEMRLVRR